MQRPPSEQEPWAIRLPGDEATRRAGDNLRAWAGDDRSPLRRFLDRVTFREERDPKLAGAWGEEVVAKELATLGDGWTVLHGIRIGPKADVDHLAIGPAGVFSLNTKRINFEARVRVTARQFRVNGYSRPYYPKSVAEAERVAAKLRAAVGTDVAVQPVIVITGADPQKISVREQPHDVAVVTRRQVVAWLARRPVVLPGEAVRRIAHAARHPSTWDPTKVAKVLDRRPEPVLRQAAEEAPASAGRDVAVVGWQRDGVRRRYVNEVASGRLLGWRDERSGRVRIAKGVDPAVVHDALERDGS